MAFRGRPQRVAWRFAVDRNAPVRRFSRPDHIVGRAVGSL